MRSTVTRKSRRPSPGRTTKRRAGDAEESRPEKAAATEARDGEAAEAADLSDLDTEAPAPARLIWRLVGRRQYARRTRRLRGPLAMSHAG